jgi:hypothetical protein
MSLTLKERLALPLPRRLRTRPRDKRGYPIPFIVLIDKSGEPQFTINDWRQVGQCITKKLCSICGKRFDDGYWFVGGSRCFMHEHGAFLDAPMHRECAEYALQVCPFLAARNYSGRIDDRKLKPGDTPDDMVMVRVDHMLPAQPERFGLGRAASYRLVHPARGETIFVVDHWAHVEWWRNGETVNAPDALPPEQPWVRFA